MADYNTSASVVLSVNGQQAKRMLSDLQKQAVDLGRKIDEATKKGDTKALGRYKRELSGVNRMMDQIKNSGKNVDAVLQRLDKATPKQLNKALSDLKRQLNGIERGSEAWKKHVEKIKMVKAELAKVNAEMKVQMSFLDRIKNKFNDWATTLMATAAALTGIVMAARKAVSEFAKMDEAMANTRKFTGLSVEGVEELNERFKAMDTRTARDKLNELAQEAGRLGKTSQEDIMGYVKAADILNVALSDLGDGATQKIAKLSNIFGVEETEGTYNAMVKIGSVINVLSQNCTASKPFLVEFTNRLAGVGKQANMTIQEIVGLGAVLDANAQKVEASATAIAQVLTRIFTDPAKYAKVVGLDITNFANLLKTDANAALIQFLESLHKAGGMNVLAPMFQDMGESGARAIAALSTLATQIDDVKWQQENANKAFEEGTSVLHEYEIFNNTAQASIDKAKKRISELTIELGEKLMPIMSHVMSSGTLMMKALNTLVDFIVKYKTVIISLTSAIVAYYTVIKAAAINTAILKAESMLLNSILVTKRASWLALKGVVALCTGNVTKAREAFKLLQQTLSTNVWGLAVAAITALGVAIYNVKKKTDEYSKSLDEVENKSASFAQQTGKEIQEISKLIGIMEGAKKGTLQYNSAKDQIISRYAVYLKGLINEKGEINNLALAYDRLTNSVLKSAKARNIQTTIDNLNQTYFKNIDEMTEKLAKSLIDLGMDTKRAYKITTEVSQDILSGRKINEKTYKEVEKFQKGAYNMFTGLTAGTTPINILKNLDKHSTDHDNRIKKLEDSKDQRVFKNMTDESLNKLADVVTSRQGKNGTTLTFNMANSSQKSIDYLSKHLGVDKSKFSLTKNGVEAKLDANDLEKVTQGVLVELYERGITTGAADTGTDQKFSGVGGGGGSSKSSGPGSSKNEDKFKAEKDWRATQEAIAKIAYRKGETDYLAYTQIMDSIAVKFYEKQLEHTDLSESERLQISADYQEALYKKSEDWNKAMVEQEQVMLNHKLAELKQSYIDGEISTEAYNTRLEELEIELQRNLVRATKEGSKERLDAEKKLEDLLFGQQQKRRQEAEKAAEAYEKELAKLKDDYFGLNAAERQAGYEKEMVALDAVYDREVKAAVGNAEELARIEEAKQLAILAIKRKYGMIGEEEYRNSFEAAISKSVLWLDTDGGKALTGAMSNVISGMSAIFSQLSSYIQAELEIQSAEINKKYEKEIEWAEGNTYKIKKLEEQKEKEIAEIKNEANRKMFAMQVIQAVAQTAQNALNAYGSAAAIPMIGYILAPMAAAMAIAAGAVQVASIKKQQQASMAQGYSEGGFTPKGPKDQEVGVVHAGEWVASQKLVNNPKTRPMILALDYAQRTNTIGSISSRDVSRSISAPMVLANGGAASQPNVIVNVPENSVYNKDLNNSLSKLNDRLDEPFFTINSVTGDEGYEQAKDKYNRLINNKSPKNRRK